VASHANEDEDDIYADTGVSHHYFKNRLHFTDYQALRHCKGNSTKKGTQFSILGVGTIHLLSHINGTECTITLRNAMHTPEIAVNLISLYIHLIKEVFPATVVLFALCTALKEISSLFSNL